MNKLIGIISFILMSSSVILTSLDHSVNIIFNIGFILFLILLGHEYKNINTKNFFKKYYLQYLLILIITILILIILDIPFSKKALISSLFLIQTTDTTLPLLSYTWILPYIAICIISLPLMKKIKDSPKFLILFFIVINLLSISGNISYSPYYFGAFVLGYYLSFKQINKKYFVLLGIISIILSLICLYIKTAEQIILPNYIVLYQNLIIGWSLVIICLELFLCFDFKLKHKFNGLYCFFLLLIPTANVLINVTSIKFLNLVIIFLTTLLCVLLIKIITKLITLLLERKPRKKVNYKPIIILLLISLFITLITFYFSSAYFKLNYFMNLLLNFKVFILNFLPVFSVTSFVYLITKRMWSSFLISDLIFIIPSFINRIKLIYRDYPFVANDLILFDEALNMSRQYSLNIDIMVISILIIIIAILILLIKKVKKPKLKLRNRIFICTSIILISFFSYFVIYTNENIYQNNGNPNIANRFSETQQFEIRGFVYSFIYSTQINSSKPPENYNEKEAENILNNYDYKKIDNQVNIIGIMLEAFNDFSRYDVEFKTDIYKPYLEIYNNSYHGYIIVNSFGGGTSDTERAFLTGNYIHADYLFKTNSYAWYFKENDYNTNAYHPGYGWFYNRRSVYENMGFDNFYYLENHFNQFDNEYNKDSHLMETIIDDFDKNTKNGEYSFQFSVTYQNHGPYSELPNTDVDYIKRNEKFTEQTHNIVNNYFAGISDTVNQLEKLINHFEKEEKPIIIVMFGDHNPFLGDGNIGYEYMEIDISGQTEETFLNKFSIPYLFWANDSAKEKLNKNFIEQGNTISPNYLMSELFSYIGYSGNEYNQYLTDLKDEMDIITSIGYYSQNRKLTETISNENKLNEYNTIQYYLTNNFEGID